MNTPQRRGRRLRGQLVSHALLSIGLPLALCAAVAYFFLAYHLDIVESSLIQSRNTLTTDIAGSDLRARADGAARQLDAFLFERMLEAKSWASAATVVDAAIAAHARHAAMGLTEASLEVVEARFRIRKSLDTAPRADAYLREQIAASPYFAELFFTDRNGYNVALTNPTSDFVQSDEDWWQSAWSHSMSVGEIEYDDSAGVWSVDISFRIDDPQTEQPVGVMKSVLAIEPVQQVADHTALGIPGGRVQITTGRGVLIAETHSGHARERIMNPSVNVQERGEPSARAAFGGERAGFAVDDVWLTGYARTGGRDAYAGVGERFSGFDWIVILQRPVGGITDLLTALTSIDDALHDWRRMLMLCLGAMGVVSLLVAVQLAAGTARRLASSMHSVREFAERTAAGEVVAPAVIERPEELAQVNEAVRHLSHSFVTVLGRTRVRPLGPERRRSSRTERP